MILGVNAFLAVLATLYGVRVGSPLLTVLPVLLLGAHAVLTARELISLINGTELDRVVTSLGVHADMARHKDLESQRLLEWEREFMRATGGRVASDPLFRNLVSESGWHSSGVLGLFQRSLTYASRRFRAVELAIIFTSDAGAISVAGLGVHGRRFEEMLKRRYRSFWSAYGPDLSVPTLARDDTRFELQAFDIHTALLLPFQWELHGRKQRGLIWLGYSQARLPSSIEEDLAQDFVTRVQDELILSGKVHDLRAQIAAAEQQSREKSDFITHVSHDIRSPLNNVKAVLALLEEEEMRNEVRTLLQSAGSSCEALEEIVNNILDLNRFRAGLKNSRQSCFEISALVAEVVQGFAGLARGRGIQLTLSRNDSVAVHADRAQLRRVFINLVSNAIKYTRHGSVTVQVECKQDGYVVIEIVDTGIGLSVSQIAALGTPFERFHPDMAEGMGLGMAITKLLIHENGGDLQVSSSQGHGSRFRVIVPRSVRSFEPELLPKASTGRSVLVIDDDLDLLESTARALSSYGFNVMKAIAVSDAISIINFSRPDLIVTDGQMPDGGGRRILEYAASVNPPVPVIVVTGDSDLRSLRAFGPVEVLQKPCAVDELIAAIETAVQNEQRSILLTNARA